MTRPSPVRLAALALVLLPLAVGGPGCAVRQTGANPFAEPFPDEPRRNWFGDQPTLDDREDLVGALGLDDLDEADQLIQQGRHAEAEGLLRGVVAAMPRDWSPRRVAGGTLQFAAWDLEEFVRARRSGALGDREVEWAQPSYSRAWFLLAKVAQHDRDGATALACLQRAVALEPDHPRVLNELGITMLSQGRPDEALIYFRSAIEARSWAPAEVCGRAYRGAAAALAQTDRLALAADLLVRSLAVEPGNPDAEEALARIRALQEDEPMSVELQELMADALGLGEPLEASPDDDRP